MSKAAMGITFDKELRTFTHGESITGKVWWQSEKEPTQIDLELKWVTDGAGTVDVGVTDKATLGAAYHHLGCEGALSFTLHVPQDAPPSYNGSIVSINWSVKATLDLPWAIDCKTVEEIIVSPTSTALDLSSYAR